MGAEVLTEWGQIIIFMGYIVLSNGPPGFEFFEGQDYVSFFLVSPVPIIIPCTKLASINAYWIEFIWISRSEEITKERYRPGKGDWTYFKEYLLTGLFWSYPPIYQKYLQGDETILISPLANMSRDHPPTLKTLPFEVSVFRSPKSNGVILCGLVDSLPLQVNVRF